MTGVAKLRDFIAPVAVTASVTLLSTVPAAAQMFFHGSMHKYGWGMLHHPLRSILVVAALGGLLWLTFQRQTPDQTSKDAPAAASALSVLRERFARGEINKDEFEERRRILEA